MLFNMTMVAGFLDRFNKSLSVTNDNWSISRVCLSSDAEENDGSVLYIGQLEADTVTCWNGSNRLVVTGAGLSDVFNAISTGMDYYNRWELRALNAVSMGASSLDSLHLLTELFPDYVVKVVNPLGKFLYSSTNDSDGYIDSSFISLLRSIPACYEIALGVKGLTVFWEYEHYRRNIMLGNIVFSDNSYVMFSVIEKSRPITETEQHLARLAQSIFEKLRLTIKLQTIIEPYESTLADILNGEEASESVLINLEMLWGHSIEDGAYLVLINNTKNQRFGNRAIVSNISEKISSALAFTYHKQVLCFLPAKNFDKNRRTLEDVASPSKSDIIFSTWIHSWDNVSGAYRQLNTILTKAREHLLESHVIYCDDYIWQFYLWSLQDSESSSLVHPDILSLSALDDRGRYLQTFYSYLKNNCHMSATADDLGIHLSTLKYRMEKINATIGFDPDNYEARMAFLISCDLTRSERAKM